MSRNDISGVRWIGRTPEDLHIGTIPREHGAMTMVLEICELNITPGEEAGFTGAHLVAEYESAEDLISSRLTQGIETPTQFVLLVEWSDIAAHERFRGTEQYNVWRAAIGPFVAGPARIQHTLDVA